MRTTKLQTALSKVILALTIIGFTACNSKGSEDKSAADSLIKMEKVALKSPADDFKATMRQLWEEHIMWTRNVIICLVDDAPGGSQAVARLLKNQDDLGNAIKTYYGETAGKKLTALLYPHIRISAEVIKAAKAGNNAALADANKRWYANADEISTFLSKANPNWQLEELKIMMNGHLKLTTEEAVVRINKNYDADIRAFDAAHIAILKMADMLSEGIVKQFPEKFKGNYAAIIQK